MWEDNYPLLHIDNQITYARDDIKQAIDTIESGIPDDVPELEYWRSCPQLLTLYRMLQSVHELLTDPYPSKLKSEVESERERESDDEARADAMSY